MIEKIVENPLWRPGSVLLALALVILSASFSISLGKDMVPISAQSLAVLLVGYSLGKEWGTLVIFLYLLLGLIGLPVFAEGKAGWAVLEKASGGFLYGFLLGAALVGYLGDLGWRRYFGKSLLAMSLGTAVIVLCGLIQLTYLLDWERALKFGFYPFIPGAIIKIILGGISLPIYYIIRDKLVEDQ